MTANTTVGNKREVIKFGILVFLETQEINLRGTLKVNMMNTVYFYVNLFRFIRNFLTT